jgi:hypothetical protein
LQTAEELQKYYLQKLYKWGEEFIELYRKKEYYRAAYRYNCAFTVASFLELPGEELTKLFGYEDDGTEEVKHDEIFRADFMQYCNWKCCIRQHKTYQDEACRRRGEETIKFYSDEDYCAGCKKKA